MEPAVTLLMSMRSSAWMARCQYAASSAATILASRKSRQPVERWTSPLPTAALSLTGTQKRTK